jgi:poly-gamma-glutamate synthesis protein (capsule biosynthesis protein)
MASVITDCGFNVVSLAGNHAMDWGPEPLLDTVELLRGKGIQTIGAGRNLAEARNLPSSNARVSGSQCSPIVPSCMKARPARQARCCTDARHGSFQGRRLSAWGAAARDHHAR